MCSVWGCWVGVVGGGVSGGGGGLGGGSCAGGTGGGRGVGGVWGLPMVCWAGEFVRRDGCLSEGGGKVLR